MSEWWRRNPMRMIQTNLREIDTDFDVDWYVKDLKSYKADVVLFNTGGAVSNYPTHVEDHYQNPFLRNDLVGEVIDKVSREGIKFISRFDFSKIHKSIGDRHPEWLYKSVDEDHVCYNEYYHTCINGHYQQTIAKSVIEEVVNRYPVNGVFFNSIGYLVVDYSMAYHGICQCANCRERFLDFSGLPLPRVEDPNDFGFRRYLQFRENTIDDWFCNIRRLIKPRNEEIAICAARHKYCDIWRKESHSSLETLNNEWGYQAGANVKVVSCTWDDSVVTNSAVHFIDFPFRHSGVTDNLTALRLAQDIANAGWLDFYVIGTLDNQYDKVAMPSVRELYSYYEQNRRYYTDVRPFADVCVINDTSPFSNKAEFRGIYNLLAQSHILFDVINSDILEENFDAKSKKYKIIILPDIQRIGEKAIETIDNFVYSGGHIVCTGMTGCRDMSGNPQGVSRLAASGIRSLVKTHGPQKGTYFSVGTHDHSSLREVDDLDVICFIGSLSEYEVEEQCTTFLRHTGPVMFGPPEKCYFSDLTHVPGVICNRYGRGTSVFFPWSIGGNYYHMGNHAHKRLLLSSLKDIIRYRSAVRTDAHPSVEITSQIHREGRWRLVSFVNHSGQIGSAFFGPLPIERICVAINSGMEPRRVFSLYAMREMDYDYDDTGNVNFVLDTLGLFETVVLEFDS